MKRPLISISDDDLCSRCRHCRYNPGEYSSCDKFETSGNKWPGRFDPDDYVQSCDRFDLSPRAVTINNEQRLYVIRSQDGYRCLGFDVAIKRATKVAEWVGQLMITGCRGPDITKVGTVEGYFDYLRVMEDGEHCHKVTRKRCEVELHPRLKGLEGKLVMISIRDEPARKVRIGKSTGWMPIHLLVEQGEDGGEGVFADEEIAKLVVLPSIRRK